MKREHRPCAVVLALGLLTTLANALAAPAALAEEEFQANTYTTSQQEDAAVACDANRDFVVTWESLDQDGDSCGVFGQRYDDAGMPLGSEFQINTYTLASQSEPDVSSDADGDFVVVWENFGQDASADGVFGRRYDRSGMELGTEFQVNTYTSGNQSEPAVSLTADGAFVVVWTGFGQDGSANGIFAQRYDSAGTTVATEFQVNTYTSLTQRYLDVCCSIDGAFVVVWSSDRQDGDDFGIFGQRYDGSGTKVGTEFQVNTYTSGIQKDPSICCDDNAAFVVVWESDGQDGSNDGVFAQRYDSAGMAVGTEFQVNTYTTFSQYGPTLSCDADGDFVVAWASFQDGDYGIFGQRYRSFGAPVGTEFQINTYTTEGQYLPSVCCDADGDFVVAWESEDQDGDRRGIFGRLFAGPGTPTSAPLLSSAALMFVFVGLLATGVVALRHRRRGRLHPNLRR